MRQQNFITTNNKLYQEFIILEREGECRTVHMRRTNTLRKVYSVNY